VGDFILLDIGGSYIKSCTLRRGTKELLNLRKFDMPPFISLLDEKREIHAHDFTHAIFNAVAIQKKFHSESTEILVSGQMGGFENSSGNLVSWQDQRMLSNTYKDKFDSLLKDFSKDQLFGLTGATIYPGLPLFALLLFPSVDRPNRFNSVISYAIGRLTGIAQPPMHITDAAASGFYDVIGEKWIPEFSRLMEDEVSFPEVVKAVSKVGYSKDFDLNVFCGVGDQQASLLGAGLNKENLVVNIGTGGQVAVLKSKTERLPRTAFRPYFENQSIATITHLPSGRALKAFVEYCCGGTSSNHYEYFFDLMLKNDSIGEIDIVNFNATLDQIKKSQIAYDYSGIAGSFFNSMLKVYSDSIKQISLNEDLVFAGGVGQKFSLLSQYLAIDLKRNTYISHSTETTLEGLALLSANV
jgi:sugar (pentulose or hexulose) kinase